MIRNNNFKVFDLPKNERQVVIYSNSDGTITHIMSHDEYKRKYILYKVNSDKLSKLPKTFDLPDELEDYYKL